MQINGFNGGDYKYRNMLNSLLDKMRASEMAKSGRAQGSIISAPGQPVRYSPKTTNSDGIEGMCITGMTQADFKTIPVSDKIRQDVIDLARKKFFSGYGMSDGEEEAALSKHYVYQQPVGDRIHASHTLTRIAQEENQRITDFVKSRVLGWQPGKSFDSKLYDEYMTSFGASVDIRV